MSTLYKTCVRCGENRDWRDFHHCEECGDYVCLGCHTAYAKCLKCRDEQHVLEEAERIQARKGRP